jgi:hypothetical protein
MLWTIAIAIGISQLLAILLLAGALRAAARADRWLERSQGGGRAA